MAEQGAPYSVEVWDTDEFFAMLATFPEDQQDRVTQLMANHLTTRPSQTRPPMLKRLKGVQAHLYQFECGGPRRLLYEIDQPNRRVLIVYLGQHPEWEKRGKVGG